MGGVDHELGLAGPGHAGDYGDHYRVAARDARLEREPELVELGAPAGEPDQIRGEGVQDPDLRSRPGVNADDLQRLPPLGDVPDVRMQYLHDRDDQVGVQPPPAGPEAVHDGGLPGQLT